MIRSEQADQGEKVNGEEFLHEHLPKQPAVTVAEAYRGMVMLADGEDRFASFEERESSLMSRKIAGPAWKLQRDQAIDRGSVAYMVTRILKIRGGVDLVVFGGIGLGDRRYALHELIYMGMIPNSPTYRYMTGSELVDLIAKADEYMAQHDMYQNDTHVATEMLETVAPPPADKPAAPKP